MKFEDLQLIDQLLRNVHAEGYTQPTPVQEQSIPHVLAGKDLFACAQTGTGKTAAFALPILQRLQLHPAPLPKHVRVLVLAPTRELATQIGESFRVYGKHMGFRYHVIYGGVGYNPQIQALKKGTDIIVATPGRLIDLIGQRHARLDKVEVLVLDEADRMLDMGFIHDVRRIVEQLPKKRQTLFYSATLPADIKALAHDILTDPVKVQVTPSHTTVEKISQFVIFTQKAEKFTLLQKLLRDAAIQRALVFTRTKHGANKLSKHLNGVSVRSDAIHGNKAQGARERSLEDFRKGKVRVLVATDIAARGIDVDGITHVFNYDLPHEPDSYVHRIGRTARAGASGIAISFCSPEERPDLSSIERLIRIKVPTMPGTPERREEVHAGGHPRQMAKHAGQRQQHAQAPRHTRGLGHGGGYGFRGQEERHTAGHSSLRPGQGGHGVQHGHGSRQHEPSRSHGTHATGHGHGAPVKHAGHDAPRHHVASRPSHDAPRQHEARPAHHDAPRHHEAARPSSPHGAARPERGHHGHGPKPYNAGGHAPWKPKKKKKWKPYP